MSAPPPPTERPPAGVDPAAPRAPHADRTAGRPARGARRVAEALATPLVPDDYLDLLDPLRAGADLRGRIVEVPPRDRRCRDRRHPSGPRLARATSPASTSGSASTSTASGTGAPTASPTGPTARPPPASRPGASPSRPRRSPTAGSATTSCARRARAPSSCSTRPRVTSPSRRPPRPRSSSSPPAAASPPSSGMLRNHLGELADVAQRALRPHRAPTSSSAGELAGMHAAADSPSPSTSTTSTACSTSRRLDAMVPDWRERETWLCGPTGPARRRREALGGGGSRTAAARRAVPPERHRARRGRPVTFPDSAVSVDADGSTAILDAGEDAGVLMPSGCRMGICFGCVLTMRAGAIRDLRTGEITVHRTRRAAPRPDLRQRRRRILRHRDLDPVRPDSDPPQTTTRETGKGPTP